MVKLSYKFEVFEGPLDMLLMLISKNKLNIYDINISTLLSQYLEQIEIMKERDMDIASEFMEMATRLVYIKSVSLLPKHEEEEDLRQELTGQLLEYQKCKEIAQILSQNVNMDKLVREPEQIPADLVYKRLHKCEELIKYYLSAVGRGKRFLPPPVQRFSGIVAHEFVSVGSQVVYLLRKLWKRGSRQFNELFVDKENKSERVAAFLAVLELIKSRRVKVQGEGDDCMVTLINGRGLNGDE